MFVLPTYLCFSLLSSFTDGNSSHRVLRIPSPRLLWPEDLCLLSLCSSATPSVTAPSLTLQCSLVPDFVSAPPLKEVSEPYLSPRITVPLKLQWNHMCSSKPAFPFLETHCVWDQHCSELFSKCQTPQKMAQAENCSTPTRLVERRASRGKTTGFIFSHQEYWHRQPKLDGHWWLIHSHRTEAQRIDWKPPSQAMTWIRSFHGYHESESHDKCPKVLAHKHRIRAGWRLCRCSVVIITIIPPERSPLHLPKTCTYLSSMGPAPPAHAIT